MKNELLDSLLSRVRNENLKAEKKVLAGFDGYVDSIIDVVSSRKGSDQYETLPDIRSLGTRIIDAAGKSTAIELVVKNQKIGGNGVIMAHSLVHLDIESHYVGNLGFPKLHPVFSDFVGQLGSFVSLAEPGFTDALEFKDGKIMLSKNQGPLEVTWEKIKDVMGKEKLKSRIEEVDLFVMGNWSNLFGMNQIWERLCKEVFPSLKSRTPLEIFVDLADPQKRTDGDIRRALDLLLEMEKYGKVTLGLNPIEAREIARILKIAGEGLPEKALGMREQMAISRVVIHPREGAAYSSAAGEGWVEGPFCKNPRLSTGAGDNFNAGLAFGLLYKFPLAEAVLLGTANSGFYVRNARSATRKELFLFLEDWAEGKVGS